MTTLGVASGGTETVKPGVPLSSPVISSGVSIVVSAGAFLDGAVTMDHGARIFALGATALGGATIGGFGPGNRIALRAFFYASTDTASFTANSAGTGGVLTVSSGSGTLSLDLLGQYIAAGFQLAADAGTGTVVTYTPPPPAPELAVHH